MMNTNNHPPRWLDRLLERFCAPHLWEEVQGDLHERYQLRFNRISKTKADWLYFRDIFSYLRPSIFKRRHSPRPVLTDMLRNYFLIAFRNLTRQKAFSVINILGLSVGMACSILILLWVQDELSYDRFHTHADQLYRLTINASGVDAAITPVPTAALLADKLPEIKNTVRLHSDTHILEVGDHKFEEEGIYYADSTFFDVFSFPLVKGDVRTALNRPDGILITERMAQKYFGQEDALGKTIRKDNQDEFVVTGVLADIPSTSHLQFDFILPMSFLARTNYDLKNNNWNNFDFYTYIQLEDKTNTSPTSLANLEKRIGKLIEKNIPLRVDFKLQPVVSIHLNSHLLRDVAGNGNIQYVRIFSVVAVFILIVACINFMNLATARSAKRAKEVGLRKVVGADRIQLIGQFLAESSLISFISLLVAVVLVWLLIPFFNVLSDKQLTLNFLDTNLLLIIGAIALTTGLLSGSYPALFLSKFQPIKVLKGNLTIAGGGSWLRNGLVVCQFVVSIIMLVGTTVVYNQLQFIKQRNLGFDKENLLYVQMTGELWSKQQAFKNELKQNPLTQNFAISLDLPTNLATGVVDVFWEGKNPQSQPLFPTMAVDAGFIDIFKMKILSGRSFYPDSKADSASYIVNEKALQIMGMNVSNAVGKSLTFGETRGTIIGVVQDFNFKPLQQSIEPVLMYLNTGGGKVIIRTQPGKTEATIQALESIHKKLNPAYPFTYHFIDQDLANLYKTENRMGDLFNAFAVLAIFISCLGLYGLSAFIAEQRTKEIGVRRVLGASVGNIVYLLSQNFTRLLLLAMIIATPLAWYASNNWLEGFAYRINIDWTIFLIACITAVGIAAITVSYESIKAALKNPVKALRNE
ncbi:ABC transporter permease [Cytophagaceae bacterium DM2B3-1]|uniref:ABC transporter permease n=1 Tax=Xanthocytophaga flava TaxID=3048013 RepID=A0ABT7CFR7_9BACT|nr:ABC transporter permease [Xanthocytophaga flavus]MDJ1492586.1 ABC transporter permease [Xanthocytophaga flavus]